jgi:hypothetical protein
VSWLFDRMCELAAADQLSVVIAADTAEPSGADGDFIGLAEVIRRASEIPQMTIWLIPGRHTPATTDAGAGECVDLAALSESAALAEIERLLAHHREFAGTVIRVSLGTIALHTDRRSHRELDALAPGTDVNHRRLFATDAAGHGETFGRLSARDLGIAVGAIDPKASIEVAGISGVTSIVDALVTLRYYAFGMNDVHEDTAARRDRDRLKLDGLDDLEQTHKRDAMPPRYDADHHRVA